MAARVYTSRIFVGADDPYPLCPFGASPPDRGSRPHRPAGTGSGPFWGYFACGRVTFCADRKSPKSRQRRGGVRISPSPLKSSPLETTKRGPRPPLWNSPGETLPGKRCVSVGAAPCGRPRADEDIGPYKRKTARPAHHRPRCMLHHLGALYRVGADGPVH